MAVMSSSESRLFTGVEAGYPQRKTFSFRARYSVAANVVEFRTHGDRVCALGPEDVAELHAVLSEALEAMEQR